ncbi:hypothetical protein NQ314_007161 [Rhamnusium bicolor]|uniref:Transposase n=1 Tax=Rhamnusium bicolor TaxID=1586634 RepID=A0AAV8YR24_9CUCU|nr:hypothetical protein NQ314_007161 [Rhamnusium bicolor]
MCTNCAETLKSIFDFKSVCLQTRNCIIHFVKNAINAKVDLKDIMYLSKKEGRKCYFRSLYHMQFLYESSRKLLLHVTR